jgi:RNA polymerase sigma-70 factor (ECF subfamily)
MAKPPSTRPSLLLRIRDARDKDAWKQFVQVYAPLIYRFARKYRLQDADAADVTQEVLKAVARASKRLNYDPRRGSFRAWLFTVVRSKVSNLLAEPKVPVGGTEAQVVLEGLPARQEDEALWDLEYERRLFNWAAEQVRSGFEESSWRAFWLAAVEGKSGKDVALALGMSVGAVYIAKSRILSRIKEQIRMLQEE